MSEQSEHVEGTPYMPDPAGWWWVRLVLDHNPCFLLSALLMFVGVFLLNAARDVHAAEMGNLLGALAAVNVYEFAILGLALWLLRRMGIAGSNRDPFLLLLIQLLFLVDGGFLINEAVQTSPHWGWVVNVVLFVLAGAKATLAMIGLKLPLRWRTLGFLVVQLALMYGLPIVLSQVSDAGEVSERAMYWVWWIVGLLPVAYDLIAGKEKMALTGRQQLLRRCYVIVPWLMLIAHLGFYHYVYEAKFTAADLSPVLLGLAVSTRRVRPTAMLPAGSLLTVRVVLPAVAVLFSLAGMDAALVLPGFGISGHEVSSALVTAAGAMVAYGYFVSVSAAAWALVGVLLMGIGRVVWPVMREVFVRAMDAGGHAARYSVGMLPTTKTGWGVLAVVAAFVMLGLGASMSLRRVRRSSEI